jgi:hypothetical protein
MVSKTLIDCYAARDQIKAQIYEITGISDIIRGHSAASETATAQEIKGRFASIRLKKMQEAVGEFAKDLLRIKAQIICKHFADSTIVVMSGAEQMNEDPQVVSAALQLIKDEPLRQFRIEITADSLVEVDEEGEKERRVEFLAAVGGFLKVALPVGQAAPQLMPLMFDLLQFGVRGFRVGKSIEGQFDQAMEALKQPQAQGVPPEQVQEMVEKARAEEQQKVKDLEQRANAEIGLIKQKSELGVKEIGVQVKEQQLKDREQQMDGVVSELEAKTKEISEGAVGRVEEVIAEARREMKELASSVEQLSPAQMETVAQMMEEFGKQMSESLKPTKRKMRVKGPSGFVYEGEVE